LLAQATTLWLAIRLLLKTQFSTGRMPEVLELIWAISGKEKVELNTATAVVVDSIFLISSSKPSTSCDHGNLES